MYRFIVLYVCIYVAPWSCEAQHFVPLYVPTCSGMTIKLNLNLNLNLRWQESIGWRERSGISKGPRGGNLTRVAVSTVALYVNTLTTWLSARTNFYYLYYMQFILTRICVFAPSLMLTSNWNCLHLKVKVDKSATRQITLTFTDTLLPFRCIYIVLRMFRLFDWKTRGSYRWSLWFWTKHPCVCVSV